ncbi:MAG: DUF5615 family PIN-like protein [Chloroflexota bacterium]
MSLRFLIDEDSTYQVAAGLRRRGVDAVSVHEADRAGLPDEEQLAFAAAEGRVLVTYNRADFQALDVTWRLNGRHHSGILWCSEKTFPRRVIGPLIERIANIDVEISELRDLCQTLGGAG